jgi:hypothetical protein
MGRSTVSRRNSIRDTQTEPGDRLKFMPIRALGDSVGVLSATSQEESESMQPF